MKRIPWLRIAAFLLMLHPAFWAGTRVGAGGDVTVIEGFLCILSIWIGAVLIMETIKLAAVKSAERIIEPFARTHMQKALTVISPPDGHGLHAHDCPYAIEHDLPRDKPPGRLH